MVADDVLVEVSRKPGDLVPRRELVLYVQGSVGHGQIRAADRALRSHVPVGMNGAATGGRCLGLDAAVSAIIPNKPNR
jgi:hypothetical protein